MKLFYFGIIFFLAGCRTLISSDKHLEPRSLAVTESATQTPPSTLSSDQVRADVALLKYALTRGYGGRKFISESIFGNVINDLSQIDVAMTPTELRDQIDKALWKIPDNHLKAKLNGQTSAIRQKLQSNTSPVGANAISDKSKFWEVRMDSFKRKKILYVSITRFPSARDKQWEGFIESVKSNLQKSSYMVLDLRGNGGGDDSKGCELAELLFGGKYNWPVIKEFYSQTPETFIIAANGPIMQSLHLKATGKPVPPYLEDLSREYMEKYQAAKDGKLPEERTVLQEPKKYQFNPTTGYNKPVYILMDAGCGSSCESTIDAFETNPNVKKVGQNTSGMVHFGNVGALVLPNSKIQIQIPTKYNEYFDGRFIEKTGIKPDISVPTGQDAYEFIKRKAG